MVAKDAGRKAPSFKQFMRKLKLDDEPEKTFLYAPYDKKQARRVVKAPDEVGRQLEQGEWGDMTIADLQSYKQRKAREQGGLDV